MKGNAKVIDTLNSLLTHEMSAADQYFIHSRMFQDWGLNELYERLKHEQEEELGHAAQLVERILFLEGTPDVAARAKLNIGADVKGMIENDLAYEVLVQKELVAAEPRRIAAVGHGKVALIRDRARRRCDGEGELFERATRWGHVRRSPV